MPFLKARKHYSSNSFWNRSGCCTIVAWWMRIWANSPNLQVQFKISIYLKWNLLERLNSSEKKTILTILPGKLGLKIKSRRVNEAFDEMMRVWLPLPKATFRAIARAPSARTAFQRHHRWNISLLFAKNLRNMTILMTRKRSLIDRPSGEDLSNFL